MDTKNQITPVKNYKKIALYWFLGPIIAITLVLLLFSVSNTVLMNMGSEAAMIRGTINFSLGALGLIAVIAIPVGAIMGIINLRKKDHTAITQDQSGISTQPGTTIQWDERSGKGEASVVPSEIQGWNWGAAGLTWIWGIYHSVWISLAVFIPFVSFFLWIILGLKGNEWAWRKTKWASVEQFKISQNKWKPWGILFFALSMINIAQSIMELLKLRS